MAAPKPQPALFADSFLESYAGHSIMHDPKIAVNELIANCWDASATIVEITLPAEHGDRFAIRDNGHGMSENQFKNRFMTFAYQRRMDQGPFTEIPTDIHINSRRAFGKNARGKFGITFFGKVFRVRTWRDGNGRVFEVFPTAKSGLAYKALESFGDIGHGTEIFVDKARAPEIDADTFRSEIGMRFLSDPSFRVYVNGSQVDFADIPTANIRREPLDIPGVGQVTITVIDTANTDRTTHHHGVAWWVAGRLVGECSWKGTGLEHFFDGRRTPAKRYTFIVEADVLNDSYAVFPDWSAFNTKSEAYRSVNTAVTDFIRDYVLELSKEQRAKRFEEIESKNTERLREMSLTGRERWESFIQEVQRECHSITDDDLDRVSSILAKLEVSDSKYSLLSQLASMDVENLEDLNKLLEKWDIDLAKIVLDELEARLNLIARLTARLSNKETNEVLDLQPLFAQGLWMFGPEFETVEYTSNQGMTTVIRELFTQEGSGSLNRPDFVILNDGSAGFYSYPKFDDIDGEEIGPDKITIVELKKPGVSLGKDETDQPMKYAVELQRKGLIKAFTSITCFVLGESIDPMYTGTSTFWDGRARVIPMDYDTVLRRAKSRTLKLHDRVSQAPFLKETRVEEFLKEKLQDRNVIPLSA